jgi:predicted signal transduction protein with EAL and GGDEF domain
MAGLLGRPGIEFTLFVFGLMKKRSCAEASRWTMRARHAINASPPRYLTMRDDLNMKTPLER